MTRLAPIISTRHYKKPIHEVWEIVTNQEYITQWLMPGNFKPVVGHQYHFETEPKPDENCGGRITGEVMMVNKPSEIKFSWKGEELVESTMVTFLLEETKEGTSFKVKHEGFVEANATEIQGYTKGWKHHQSLIDLIENYEKQS